MNTPDNDERQMTRYLLGALPAAETEHLDELSITDSYFNQRLQAVEYDLVDAFVQGELDGQALEQFKSLYLSSAKGREKVEFARTLHAIAGDSAVEWDPVNIGQTPSGLLRRTSAASRGQRTFAIWGKTWQWGVVVAGLLLASGIGWLAVENQRLRRQNGTALAQLQSADERIRQAEVALANRPAIGEKPPEKQTTPAQDTPSAESPVIMAFSLAPQLRGAGEMSSIVISNDVDYVTLQVELESSEYSSYRAELRMLPGRQTLWTSGRVRSHERNNTRFVPVSFRARLLRQSQVYLLELSGVGRSGRQEPAGTYPFRVIRK